MLGSRAAWTVILATGLNLAFSCSHTARAANQLDPELRAVVQNAIAETECTAHGERFDEEVFLKLQEPRLKKIVSDPDLRHEILRQVYCTSNAVADRYRKQRNIDLPLTPDLVLAVIDVESNFNRYAVSSAGAVGLMQIMPFWPNILGVKNRLFGTVDFNVRLGCEILAFYMEREHNDYRRALALYNGSPGRREYPDLVLSRLTSRWRS